MIHGFRDFMLNFLRIPKISLGYIKTKPGGNIVVRPLSLSRIVILATIAQHSQGLHIGLLLREIAHISRDVLSICGIPANNNMLYQAVHRLKSEGLLRGEEGKVLTITPTGLQIVSTFQTLYQTLFKFENPPSLASKSPAGARNIALNLGSLPSPAEEPVGISELREIWDWVPGSPENYLKQTLKIAQMALSSEGIQDRLVTLWAKIFHGIDNIQAKDRPKFDESIADTMKFLKSHKIDS
jgi:hypothetical protein